MIEATLELRRQVHTIAAEMKQEGDLRWSLYASLAEGLDEMVDGNPDPWDCLPFSVYKNIEDNSLFDDVLVQRFREEWAKDIAWASVDITGKVADMKKAMERG